MRGVPSTVQDLQPSGLPHALYPHRGAALPLPFLRPILLSGMHSTLQILQPFGLPHLPIQSWEQPFPFFSCDQSICQVYTVTLQIIQPFLLFALSTRRSSPSCDRTFFQVYTVTLQILQPISCTTCTPSTPGSSPSPAHTMTGPSVRYSLYISRPLAHLVYHMCFVHFWEQHFLCPSCNRSF